MPFLTPVEFSHALPSIDELEEIDGRRAMTDTGSRSDNSGSSASKSTSWPGNSLPPGDRSPNVGSKSFPVLPVDHRPASPANRTLSIRGFSSPLMPSAELHVKNMEGTVRTSQLYVHKLKVFILNVRTREAFRYEHIRVTPWYVSNLLYSTTSDSFSFHRFPHSVADSTALVDDFPQGFEDDFYLQTLLFLSMDLACDDQARGPCTLNLSNRHPDKV